jgi:epoxyqueuosine reductase
VSLQAIDAAAAADGLTVLGAFHPEEADPLPDLCGTLVLLGPREPEFWDVFRTSVEFGDGCADPLNRWSVRVIGALADRFGAQSLHPFGGPPHLPFIAWAQRTRQAWTSPVELLVHETAGLFVSYRGALALVEKLELPSPGRRPCDRCAQPCLAACPVGALGTGGYDVASCHAFLDTVRGQDCLGSGCAVRRACPVGRGRRPHAQSAFHMAAFHGRHRA